MSENGTRRGLLAVIPARGGSRRIPRKNVRPLLGRPILAYTIDAARQSGLFERVIVSTDDPDIAATAREYGADVPFRRSAQLSDDLVPVSEATADALERLDPNDVRYAAVAQLMPNCPLRTADDVCASHAAFLARPALAQLSVTSFGWMNPWWAMQMGAAGQLEPLFPDQATSRSQDLPELVCVTGAVWWASSATLRSARTFHVPGRTGFSLPWWRAVDIDTEDDWRMAESLACPPLREAARGH